MNQVQNEISHHGILGMHWGKHKPIGISKKAGTSKADIKRAWDQTNNNTANSSKQKKTPMSDSKKLAIGKSIVAGIVAGNVGSIAAYGLTKNSAAAQITGKVLGAIGGYKYYKHTQKK